jgi:hypothetical protein
VLRALRGNRAAAQYLRRVCRNVYLGSFQQTEIPEEPTEFDSMAELARFLKTVVLGHRLERLPESER